MGKLILLLFILITFTPDLFSQTIQELGNNALQTQVKAYSNLDNANIEIKIHNRGSAMAAAYTWWSIFVPPQKRKYRIKINQNVGGPYNHFQFDNLSPTARNGVIGHELAHIDFFHTLGFFGFVQFAIQQILPGGLKKSEQATDYRAIKNGLGKELKIWSAETRAGFRESAGRPLSTSFGARYLTPNQIDSVMKLFPDLYE